MHRAAMAKGGGTIKYRDFGVKIEPKQGDVYPVSVASPGGEDRSELRLPFAPEEVGLILANLGHTVRGSGAASLRDLGVAQAAPCPSAEELGDQLFAALFSGPVRSLFDWSLGKMHGTDTGLRIKIHIDATDPSLAQLASLPWEFLYRRETRDWLNLSRYTPIVRYLDVPRPHTPLALDPPLRILVVLSEPADCRRLDLPRERGLIEDNWARLPSVEVEFLTASSAERLGDRLTENRYHIVHYMGHGDFDERTGRGVLLMEDEARQASPIDGPTLGILLRDVPTLRLVVLNACETARLTKERGLDPFAGVASSLVMAGIPAVVAMQFPISDDAAITFARRFYALLARGEAVDTAVAEGRRAVRTSRPDTLEWGTPVLFMRAADGVIFRVSGAAAVAAAAAGVEQEPASAGEEPAHREAKDVIVQFPGKTPASAPTSAEAKYVEARAAMNDERWDDAVRLFEEINKCRPGYHDSAKLWRESKRQAGLVPVYKRLLQAYSKDDWHKVVGYSENILREAPSYKDVEWYYLLAREKLGLTPLPDRLPSAGQGTPKPSSLPSNRPQPLQTEKPNSLPSNRPQPLQTEKPNSVPN
jgi:hypothetical protein